MTGHLLLDWLFVLFFIFLISWLSWKIYGSMISKRYNIDLKPKFDGIMDLDKKHVKTLMYGTNDLKMRKALKTILMLRAISIYSFTSFAIIIILVAIFAFFRQ